MNFKPTNKDRSTGLMNIIYGAGGTHKSTIIAEAVKQAPKGIFISVGEDGISPLQREGSYGDLSGITTLGQTVKGWDAEYIDDQGTIKGDDGILPVLRWLAGQDYTDIAIDSLTMIAPALEEFCFRKYYVNQNDKGKSLEELRTKANGFGKSDILNFMAQEWSKLLDAFRFLREKGVNIYITAHTRITKGRLIDEELEFDTLDLDLPNNKNVSLSTPLYNMSDNFLCALQETTVLKGNRKNTARLGDEVVLQSSPDAYRKAKSRLSIEDMIPATFSELRKFL